MKKIYDLIIIGCGAAGMMAAAQSHGLEVLVLERNGQAGKKVLISGKGQCNFTHDTDARTLSKSFGNHENFVKHAIGKFTPEMTRQYFKERGVESVVMENGKVFPKSLHAGDLVEVMLNEALDHGVDIQYKSRVNQIEKTDEGIFKVTTLKQVLNLDGDLINASYRARFVLVTTGGLTYGVTGSEGDGYHLAAGIGHEVIRPKAALAPIYHQVEKLKDLAGVSIQNAQIKHWREGKQLKQYSGDLLFTHKGLSGPVILNNSRFLESGDQLKLSFLPMDSQTLEAQFLEAAQKQGKGLIQTTLRQWCYTKSLADFVMTYAGVDEQITFSQMNKELRGKLVSILTNFTVDIHRVGGPEIGMVTAGGISLEEVKGKSMASKTVEGLYFAGEVLDVDGDTGGYNIQWAFSSAVAALNDIKSKCISL